MDLDVEGDDIDPQLQIDLGVEPSAEQKTGAVAAGAAERQSAMTWLQAAEHVLREEGPEMHIRDLTRTILELGMVRRDAGSALCMTIPESVHSLSGVLSQYRVQ